MLLLLPTYLVAYLPTINLYRFFRSTLTPHRHYRREASKHTAKPCDALAVGLDYILSTRCPKALRTHNHLVSEPSSPAEKLGCGLSLSSTFLPLGTAINRVPNFHLHRNSGSRRIFSIKKHQFKFLNHNYIWQ